MSEAMKFMMTMLAIIAACAIFGWDPVVVLVWISMIGLALGVVVCVAMDISGSEHF